jgi:hypothetical protein
MHDTGAVSYDPTIYLGSAAHYAPLRRASAELFSYRTNLGEVKNKVG